MTVESTKKYSLEFKSKVVNDYKQGKSISSIGKEYDLYRPTILKWVKDAGVYTVKKKLSDFAFLSRDEILKLAKEYNPNQIAKKFGLNPATVRERLDKLDIHIKHKIIAHNRIEAPSKSILEELYCIQALPMLRISKQYNVTVPTVRRWLRDYGIKQRQHSEEQKLTMSRFNEKFFEENGRHFQDNPNTIQKSIQTKIDRYGTAQVLHRAGQKYLEDELPDWANSLGASFITHNWTILKTHEIDAVDETRKIGVEFCGLYWHNELSKTKKYHYDKYKKCLDNGYRLITIFEDEWLKREKQVKNFLKSILFEPEIKLYARDCEFREITKYIAKDFCENVHIQGAPLDSVFSAGLFHKDKLVGVITFSKHHRNTDKNIIVLSRLCFADGTQIVGGASKLFQNSLPFLKSYNQIISWSDNRWSEGNVYKQLGFTMDAELPVDYSYVDNKKPHTRLSKQSFKIKNELKMTLEAGLVRIWDCGKKRWIFNISN